MIFQTLLDFASILNKAKIGYMFIGGQAVIQYGIPRFTQDIDVTVAFSPDDFLKIKKIVNKKFRVLPNDPEKFILQKMVLPIENIKTKVRIDVIFSESEFEREAIKNSRKIIVNNYPINFISPEDLIIQKIFAGRPRDLEDVRSILSVQGKKIDKKYVERKLKLFQSELATDELLPLWNQINKTN